METLPVAVEINHAQLEINDSTVILEARAITIPYTFPHERNYAHMCCCCVCCMISLFIVLTCAKIIH